MKNGLRSTVAIGAMFVTSWCSVRAPAQSIHEGVDFDTEVLPVVEIRCGCHIGTAESGVELSSYESLLGSVGDLYGSLVVTPYDGLGSVLWDVIFNEPPEFGRPMPPTSDPATFEEIDRIVAWIDQGARPTSSPSALRGDVDGNVVIDLSDAVVLLTHLFQGGPAPACTPSADANADGLADLTDAIYILSHLFQGGPGFAPLTPAEREECLGGGAD